MNMRVFRVGMQRRDIFPRIGNMRLVLEHFLAPLPRNHEGVGIGHIVWKRQNHVARVAVAGTALPVLRPCVHQLLKIGLREGVTLGGNASGKAESPLGFSIDVGELARELPGVLNACAGDTLHERAASRGEALPDPFPARLGATSHTRPAHAATGTDQNIIIETGSRHGRSPACSAALPFCRTSRNAADSRASSAA